MNVSARLASILLGLGRVQAVVAIVGASVAGSLLLTVSALLLLGDNGLEWGIPVFIATVIPTLVATPVGVGLMSLLRELDSAHREAHRLANTDLLTGLFNRRRWLEVADRELRAAREPGIPIVLLMLDVDHFKQVNDIHGHVAGDAVLRSVAEICGQALRERDALARWGGEEFVMLLPDVSLDEGVALAERIRNSVAATVTHSHGKPISVTASLGVASTTTPGSGHDIELLLHFADCAMYTAKASGRNCVQIADLSQSSHTGRHRSISAGR